MILTNHESMIHPEFDLKNSVYVSLNDANLELRTIKWYEIMKIEFCELSMLEMHYK